MSKVIVTDMDDVLVDLLSEWLNTLNKNHNLDVRKEDIKEWEMSKAFPTLYSEQLYAPLFTEELWSRVAAKEGSVEGLRELHDRGFTIYVATASHYRTLKSKLELCLFKHFDFLNYNDVIVCYNKQLIDCDYIIDDKIDNLVGHTGITFLMDAPYNKDVDETLYDFRVKTLQEVAEIIEAMEELENE